MILNFFKKPQLLGINARNLLYIRPYNRKKAIRLADNKIKTKHFLKARGIPVPKLFAAIRTRKELESFDFNTLPNSFVLKPNFGFGGGGIIPIEKREEGYFVKPGGDRFSTDDLRDHISDILDGRFSISGIADTAFFEQRIISDPTVGKYAYGGLPDIRIVVHNLIPVMAMLRVPTKESGGRGNLHQGALGVGIDIARGTATYVVKGSKVLHEVPGFGEIRNLKIPHWDEMLMISSKIQFITNLGYMAVDLSLDKTVGPILLEINARAGLAVQIANLAPLRKRLERIEGVKVSTPEKGVRIAKDMFGEQIEKEVEEISGKQVVGNEETVDLILRDGTRKVLAQINNEQEVTVLDVSFARAIGLPVDSTVSRFVLNRTFKLKLMLEGVRIQTLVTLRDLKGTGFKLIIGRRDLAGFLIDPTKKKASEVKLPKESKETKSADGKSKVNFFEVDRQVTDIDREVKLLYHLTPVNLAEEKEKFLKDPNYNPQFVYPDLKFESYALRERLKTVELDDSILGRLYDRKKYEILDKIDLIEKIGSEGFTKASIKLFGAPTLPLVEIAQPLVNDGPLDEEEKEDKDLTAAQVAKEFEAVFEKYDLSNWRVKLKPNMVANAVAGKQNTLFVKEDARFSSRDVKALIAHEIETHILTAENGKLQPYQLLSRGMANYLITQEGLALYNAERAVGVRRRTALSVMACKRALENSFSDVFDYLKSAGVSMERAFQVAMKMKRGLEDTGQPGGFTKDIIYLKGREEVKTFLQKGGEMKDLYRGKFDLGELDLILQVPNLREAKYLPEWLV